MQKNDIEPRQNRIVYVLMGLIMAAALAWVLWRH